MEMKKTWPCIKLPIAGGELLYCPKVPLDVAGERVVPDALIGYKQKGKVEWLLMEIDEAGVTPESRRREELLNMPTLRATPTDIMRPDFTQWLADSVKQTLKRAA